MTDSNQTATKGLAQARQIYKNVIPKIFQRRNVVACGLGYKISAGEPTGKLSLIVSVVEKIPSAALTEQDIIPQNIDGLSTDVIEIGRLRAQFPADPKLQLRPAQPGSSIGHRDITAGTFGYLVRRDNELFILSNNHVLANCNDAKIGDPIYQPGAADGGTRNERIAALAEFQPLDFGEEKSQCAIADSLAGVLNLLAGVSGSSHRLQPVRKTPGVNLFDAALARPDSADLVTPEILDLGIPTGVAGLTLGQKVQKMGRTTGLTEGGIVQIDVTANVEFQGRVARFDNQVFTTKMSSPGDSGSAILDMDKNAVGLLFAGSDRVTIFTPIQRVLDHFRATLVTQSL